MATRPFLIALAAAALVSGGRAGAFPQPAAAGEPAAPARTEAPPPSAPAPQPIPVEHVFRAADELEAPLQRAEVAAERDPALEQVELRLASAAPIVERLRSDLAPQRLEGASAREIER